MSAYSWSGFFALLCLVLLSTFCLCEWVKWWRARRDERGQQTDSDIRAFLAYGYKRGWTTRSWRDQYPFNSEL